MIEDKFIKILLAITFLGLSIYFLYIGNQIIKYFLFKSRVLDTTTVSQEDSEPLKNGSRIGFYERVLYFIGIVTQNWILVSLVVGLKTISRYQKLDNQNNAEYFLIGSLLSLIYSIIVSMLFIFSYKIFGIEYLDYIYNLTVHNINVVNLK
jgi:hypothetical protein